MSRFITHEGNSGEATFDVKLLKKPLYKNGNVVYLEKPCSWSGSWLLKLQHRPYVDAT